MIGAGMRLSFRSFGRWWSPSKSIRITTLRSVARATSWKPAASKMLRVPTWVSPQVISCAGLGDHRVGLEGPGAALAGERDRRGGERPAHAAATVAGAGREADDGPDRGVLLVLAALLPGDAGGRHRRVCGPRLDRAPADRLAVEVGDQAARDRRAREVAVRLGAEAFATRRRRSAQPPRVRPDLEALALAGRRVAARAEDREQVLPGGLVRGHDRVLGAAAASVAPSTPSCPVDVTGSVRFRRRIPALAEYARFPAGCSSRFGMHLGCIRRLLESAGGQHRCDGRPRAPTDVDSYE